MSSLPTVVILAAGEGTRMKSSLPKVLHRIGGAPMVQHVARAAATAFGDPATAVVVGPGMDAVAAGLPSARAFVQKERLGTAHAVLQARDALEAAEGPVLVLYGDTPLIRPDTLERLVDAVAAGAAVAVLGFRAADPTGYGRLLMRDGHLAAIREERDASDEERRITLCNSGVMAFAPGEALRLLERIGNDNAKGEYYLTDAVGLAVDEGLRTAAIECPEREVLGVNTRAQLAVAEGEFQARARAAAMEEGATLVAPDTVFFSHDTQLAPDVVIEPNVVFGPGVEIEAGATIRAFSHLEGARVSAGATVGPYARLRPGAQIGQNVHIGNFVEVKATTRRARREDQPSELCRRQPGGRGRECRRRDHHLQLRRLRQAPDGYRRRRLHRLEQRARRPGEDRRRRLCRLRQRHHQGRGAGCAGDRARPAGGEGRLGAHVPDAAQQGRGIATFRIRRRRLSGRQSNVMPVPLVRPAIFDKQLDRQRFLRAGPGEPGICAESSGYSGSSRPRRA